MTANKLQLAIRALPPPPDGSEELWHIDMLRDPADNHMAILINMGLNYDCVSRETKLSKGQIARRLKEHNRRVPEKEKITARNYRNGTSRAAQAVIELAGKRVAEITNQSLRVAQASAIDV